MTNDQYLDKLVHVDLKHDKHDIILFIAYNHALQRAGYHDYEI